MQKDLRTAAESLREASEQPEGAEASARRAASAASSSSALSPRIIALVVSEDARKTVLDALFGAEEEFEYTSTTSINGS